MNHHSILLNLSKTQTDKLESQYAALLKSLENGMPITPTLMADLQSTMSEILQRQDRFADIADDKSNHHTVHLMHADNFILNLPWRMAVSDNDFLSITKGLPTEGDLPKFEPDNPLPLKVLVMIASPDGGGARLSYEEEEAQIIQDFAPLYENAQVEMELHLTLTI